MTARPGPSAARWLTVALAVVALAGCNSTPTRDPEFAAVRPALVRGPDPTPGAIYQPGTGLVLFSDDRARRVGDLLTIALVEQTDAKKSAETSTSKSSSATIANPTLLGSTPSFGLPSLVPLASTRDNTLETSISAERSFDGTGESTQSNALSGEITVTVAEVLPNGNLVVQGEKLMTLNQGHEHVRFSGIVRPRDIDANNTVASTRVANARIVYAGEGAVQSSNVVGWLGRFFSSVIFPL